MTVSEGTHINIKIKPLTVKIPSLRILTYPLSRGPPKSEYIIYNMYGSRMRVNKANISA